MLVARQRTRDLIPVFANYVHELPAAGQAGFGMPAKMTTDDPLLNAPIASLLIVVKCLARSRIDYLSCA